MKPMPVIRLQRPLPGRQANAPASSRCLDDPQLAIATSGKVRKARAARPLFAIPADRNRERKGCGERDDMSADLKSVQARPRKNKRRSGVIRDMRVTPQCDVTLQRLAVMEPAGRAGVIVSARSIRIRAGNISRQEFAP